MGDTIELYDVRKAKQIVIAAPRAVESSRLDERHRAFFGELLEAVRVKPDIDWQNIDTQLPVIFARGPDGKRFPIDGRHRLAKALVSGQEYLPAVTLTEEETAQIRTV
jgi:hypothetical protein